jgi:hypothetical protein
LKIDRQFVEHLKSKVIEHAVFRDVMELVLGKIQFDGSTGFGLVIGVTGVGKTTAIRRLAKILSEHVASGRHGDLGPPIVLAMAAPERQVFSWPDFYRTSLVDGIKDPFFEKRVDLEEAMTNYIRDGVRHRYHVASTFALRKAFIEGTNHRRPIALFIDEVQQLCKVTTREKAHVNLDVLKSLSDVLRCPVIAAGTSKAYDMLYENEQTARRADVITFRRYGASDDDAADYRDVILGIEKTLGVPLAKDIAGDSVYFYRGTLGCVGITMDWVLRAVALCAKQGQQVVTRQHFERKRLEDKALEALVRAIKTADALQRDRGSFDAVANLGETNTYYGTAPPKPRSAGAAKPGRRSPTLDPAGGLESEMARKLR